MIKLVRVDYRLLHGQVIVSWIKGLGIDRIIIINDLAYKDEITKRTLLMAKPENCKLNIFSVQQALLRKSKISKLKEKVALIFGDVKSCASFIEDFPGNIDEINFGNIPNSPGSNKFDTTVYLTEQDRILSKKLVTKGIRIYSRQVPTTKLKELNNLL